MIYDRDPNLNFFRWTKNGTIGRVRNQNSGPEALMDDLWSRPSGLTSQAPCGCLELEGSMIINLALVGSVSRRTVAFVPKLRSTADAGPRPSPFMKVRCLAWRTTFASILISFFRNVVIGHVFMGRGRISWCKKLPKLYVRAENGNRTWLSTKSWQDSFVHFTAFLPRR